MHLQKLHPILATHRGDRGRLAEGSSVTQCLSVVMRRSRKGAAPTRGVHYGGCPLQTRTHNTLSLSVPLWLLALTALVLPASARAQQPSSTPVVQVAVATQPAQAAQPAAPAGDPYGFTNWLNATRAAYGLAPVGYDPNLAGWAQVNNSHQNAYGMGHHVMGPARRQNSAMGDYMSVPGMWMSSPAHREALLDPTIRWIGIAGLGAYWTFNAY